MHPQDLDTMLDAMREHARGQTPHYEAQFRLRSNGSGYRVVRSRGRVVERDAHGRVLRMVGVMVDLTDRPCTPAAGLPEGTRGAMAGATLRLPLHVLLMAPPPGPEARAERQQVLQAMEDLLLASLADLPPDLHV